MDRMGNVMMCSGQTNSNNRPLSFIRVHPSKTIVFYVYTTTTTAESLQREKRERKRILGNEWMIETSATLLVYRLKRESHAYNNNHHVFIFISILFSLSLHCLPI
jgi:hypothetical protein